MNPHLFIRALAGFVVLLTVGLGVLAHPAWLLLTAFAGFNLLQSAFTGFCPPLLLLQRLGWIHRDGLVHLGPDNSLRSKVNSPVVAEPPIRPRPKDHSSPSR